MGRSENLSKSPTVGNKNVSVHSQSAPHPDCRVSPSAPENLNKSEYIITSEYMSRSATHQSTLPPTRHGLAVTVSPSHTTSLGVLDGGWTLIGLLVKPSPRKAYQLHPHKRDKFLADTTLYIGRLKQDESDTSIKIPKVKK